VVFIFLFRTKFFKKLKKTNITIIKIFNILIHIQRNLIKLKLLLEVK